MEVLSLHLEMFTLVKASKIVYNISVYVFRLHMENISETEHGPPYYGKILGLSRDVLGPNVACTMGAGKGWSNKYRSN
jgi:hypothetical protein